MGRSWRCSLALVSLLNVLFLLSPEVATARHSDVIEDQLVYSGRRGLLQTPPAATPPTPAAKPPTPAAKPPTPAAKSPTPAGRPPAPAVTPPAATGAKPPGPVGATVPPATPPLLAPPPMAPAPAPIGVTSRQKSNAIIAVSVVAGVILIGIVCIFCRCQWFRRSKKLPFQRLQMT